MNFLPLLSNQLLINRTLNWLYFTSFKRYIDFKVTSESIGQKIDFSNGGILSGYSSLLALHLSGTPSLKTGTSPPKLSTPRQPSTYPFRDP